MIIIILTTIIVFNPRKCILLRAKNNNIINIINIIIIIIINVLTNVHPLMVPFDRVTGEFSDCDVLTDGRYRLPFIPTCNRVQSCVRVCVYVTSCVRQFISLLVFAVSISPPTLQIELFIFFNFFYLTLISHNFN